MYCIFSRALMFALAITVTASSGFSQEPTRRTTAESSLPDAPQPHLKDILIGMPRNLLKDQAGIWTSPTRIRSKDFVWLAPLAVATGVSILADLSVPIWNR
jgi:hypothetical protein